MTYSGNLYVSNFFFNFVLKCYLADAEGSKEVTPSMHKRHHRSSISDDSLSRSASDSSMTNPMNNNSKVSLERVASHHRNTVSVEATTAEPEYTNEEANGGDFDDNDLLPVLGTCRALYSFDGKFLITII